MKTEELKSGDIGYIITGQRDLRALRVGDTITLSETPSKDLACISISPGKAYVRGYEIETISNTIVDIEKPRTTRSAVINKASTSKLPTK